MTINPTLISDKNVTGESEDEPRLTTKRYAVLLISKYKLIFTKVPFPNKQGVDEVYRLALEVNAVRVVGAEGEGTFANPKDIEEDNDMHLWAKGLRTGDGSG